MADNDKNNMSGDSRVPKSTKGLEGSVSLEDLKKYHLIDTGDENTPTNNTVSEDQTTHEEQKPVEDNPTPASADHLQSEESNDHLSEAKQDTSEVDDTKFVPTPPVPPVTSKESKESVEDSKATSDAQPDAKKEEDVKPWEKSFDSDTDEEGHVSRAVTKEKQRGNHTLVVTLVIALIVIMFTPVIINAVKGSGSGDLDSAQSESSVENKDKSTKKKSNKKASTKKKTTAKKSTKKSNAKKKSTTDTDQSASTANNSSNSNSTNDTASDTTANNSTDSQTTDNSQQTQQSQQSDQQASNTTTTNDNSSTTDSSDSSTGSYYTVKAGDNWFRIAYNNNLTTAQLKSMNGNVGTLTPGTTLRVK